MIVQLPISISSIEEYLYAKSRGHEPLIDVRFTLPIELRIDLQQQFRSDEQFYRWFWDHKPHYCEETGQPLRYYSAVHVSHILTRGSHPEMRHDARNCNLLSFRAHAQWDRGSQEEKEQMNIYYRNEQTIETLLVEYANLLQTDKWNS